MKLSIMEISPVTFSLLGPSISLSILFLFLPYCEETRHTYTVLLYMLTSANTVIA
jgi:hypothetical protein